MVRSEFNARIHLAATVGVVIAATAFEVDRGDWLALILVIGFVWATEAFNTAIEALADVVSQAQHPGIARAKDLAAGGVLISAITAVIVAILIFGPRMMQLFST